MTKNKDTSAPEANETTNEAVENEEKTTVKHAEVIENVENVKDVEELEEMPEEVDYLKEIEDLKNRYFRALADYQNLQRRAAKEVLEARNRGIEDLIKKMLPVIDTLEHAVNQISKFNVDKKIMDGLEMFSIQFTDVLEKEGLKCIPAKGRKFDPNFHEAMCKKTVEGVEDELILAEYEKGYTFKERVLRTAKVEINQS